MNINFPRSPKLVCIDTKTMTLSGYHGKKCLTKVKMDNIDEDTTSEDIKEVIEEFRESINAPLKGKTKK
jgi:ribosomal protein L1